MYHLHGVAGETGGARLWQPCLLFDQWIGSNNMTDCPCCYTHQLNDDHVCTPSQTVVQLLNHLMKSGPLDAAATLSPPATPSPSNTTIKEILSKSTSSPTTPMERKLTEKLVRRMMAEGESSIIKLPTRGQVCYEKHNTIYLFYIHSFSLYP